MDDIKVKVNNEAESREVQGLFFELGYKKNAKFTKEDFIDFGGWICALADGSCDYCPTKPTDKELTIPELRDLVVLKRNDVGDATHTDQDNWKWYIGVDSYVWQAGNAQQLKQWDKSNLDHVDLKPIEKDMSVLAKEYLDKDYVLRLVRREAWDSCVAAGWIEVPPQHNFAFKRENCDVRFSKDSFNYYFGESIIWQRNPLINSQDSKKEYLKKYDDGSYVLMDGAGYSGQEDWIEVPQGSEILCRNEVLVFYRNNGSEYFELESSNKGWRKSKWTNEELIRTSYVDVLWQRPTKPEELPFVDDEPKDGDSVIEEYNRGVKEREADRMRDEPKGINKGLQGLAQASKKLSDKISVDKFEFKFMTEPPQTLNDLNAEIEQVRQNSKLDQSISDFKNTDHGKEFDEFELFADEPQRENNHYFIDVSDVDDVDFYEIAKRYNVTDPAIQHILKKCLAIGNRGHKDLETDLNDILKTAKRALVINGFNSKGESK